MAFSLIQAAYQSQGWVGLLLHPHDRAAAIRPGVEGLGGRIVGLWFAFGDYDLVGIFEMPDNVSIVAFMLAAAANPAVKAIKTTPLLTMEEGIAAMQRAPQAGYRPPNASCSPAAQADNVCRGCNIHVCLAPVVDPCVGYHRPSTSRVDDGGS